MRVPAAPLALAAAATGCINLKQMPPDQPCKEAGYAIASRIFDCTADGDLANATYERFEEEYACVLWDLEEEPDPYGSNVEKDLFHCSLTIGAMECEQVLACGEDLDCFLSTSPACGLVVTYADGSALSSGGGADSGSGR
ncbi:hypothetical protein L6R53_01495 [Myxococcota bacterium]|nr:hypothetical protein [Myxococcota bacterium]